MLQLTVISTACYSIGLAVTPLLNTTRYGGESHSFGSFPSHVGRFCGGLMLRRVDVVGFEGKVWKNP